MSTEVVQEQAQIRVFATPEEVMAYYQEDKENNTVVIFEGKVFNTKEYMPDHPGGADYIEKHLGENIEEPFEEAEHTKAARRTIFDLPLVGVMQETDSNSDEGTVGKTEMKAKNGTVANLFGEEFTSKHKFDYDAPLLWQIWNTAFTLEEYAQFINEPKILTNPVRDILLFHNPILEALSKSHWWMIPVFWGFYAYYQYTLFIDAPAFNIACIIFGMFWWTLGEYLFHRFVFHGEEGWMTQVPECKEIFTFHFMIHGIHHAFPSDRLRLVFPPIPGYLLNCFIVHPMFALTTPDPYFRPMICGFWMGYVVYDLIHYYLHHGQNMNAYLRDLKVYHMQHHYKYGHIGYGVSSKVWDYVFDTKIDTTSNKKMPTVTDH